MGDFKRSGNKRFGGVGSGRRDGGRSNFPRKSWGGSGGNSRGPVTMHQAVCNQCGKSCEVPFRPTEGKPVYCNVCFETKKKTGDDRGGDRFPQKSFNSYKAPIRSDFGGNTGRSNNDELKKQLEILSGKIDQLIKIVESIKNNNPLMLEKGVKAKVKKVKEIEKKILVIKPIKKAAKKILKKTKK